MVWSQVDALGLRMLVCPARCGFLDSEVCLSHSMEWFSVQVHVPI